MSEFTKGKWIKIGNGSVEDAHGEVIAKVYGPSSNEKFANQRLIAEAPAMYELLEKMVSIIDNREDGIMAWAANATALFTRINNR